MTTGVEEVMGKEVVAQSNLLRGPGESMAAGFSSIGCTRHLGSVETVLGHARAGTPHAVPSTTTLTGALGVDGRRHRTRQDSEEETEVGGVEAGQRDGRRKEEGSRSEAGGLTLK